MSPPAVRDHEEEVFVENAEVVFVVLSTPTDIREAAEVELQFGAPFPVPMGPINSDGFMEIFK